MPALSESQKRQSKLRRAKWERAEKPFYAACLTCSLSCEQVIQHGAMSYDITTCPKANKGALSFPYALQMIVDEKKKREEARMGT